MHDNPYRVVQWATGNIGLRSLRAVIEHPDLELVGLFVYSPDKVGRDAGTLCGLEETGVVATDDVEQILALRPDCVLFMGDRADVDILCRLLEAGANVVSTRASSTVRPGSTRRCGSGSSPPAPAAARRCTAPARARASSPRPCPSS